MRILKSGLHAKINDGAQSTAQGDGKDSMMQAHSMIPIEQIRQAQRHIKAVALRTPLVRLQTDQTDAEIYLKLENLQPVNSFKIRGAVNAIEHAQPAQLAKGVWTASAGNMALALAWYAKKIGVKCTVLVSDLVPQDKLTKLKQHGCLIKKVPFHAWVEVIQTHQFEGLEGVFVHPVSNVHVMAGNGTIGVEILEDLPDVDSIIMPYGLGGLVCGIGSALRQLQPHVSLYASETQAATPLASSVAAGKQVSVDYNPSFVDAMGAPMLLAEMWPLAKSLIDDVIVNPLSEVAAAMKQLAEQNRIIAEGAGAVSVAAALSGKAGSGKIVCVVSGGNIDTDKLITILSNRLP
jgi:threonine dehydratase